MTDHEADKPPAAIKVVDRRRFTPEGRARPGAERHPSPAATVPAEPGAARARASEPPAAADSQHALGEARGPGQHAGASAHAPDRAAQRPATAAREPVPGAQAPLADEGAEPEPRLEFMPFIASLATTALASLGLLPEAQGGGMPKNPAVAREYIDVIIMLERRTRGNLTPEEAQTLTQLVADLKLQYVEATRSVQPARHMPAPPRG